MKKLSPKQVDLWCIAILALGALVGLIGVGLRIKALAGLGFVLLLGNIIFRLVCCRCPHCGKYLDRSRGNFCPHCGKKWD